MADPVALFIRLEGKVEVLQKTLDEVKTLVEAQAGEIQKLREEVAKTKPQPAELKALREAAAAHDKAQPPIKK